MGVGARVCGIRRGMGVGGGRGGEVGEGDNCGEHRINKTTLKKASA